MKKREIKFRVWDNAGYMSSVFTLKDLQEIKIQFTDDCPVMQFTGLIDWIDKDIFEGDICKNHDGSIGLIEWDDDTAGWCRNNHDDRPDVINEIDFGDFEVIGNIYENSYLMPHYKL